MSQISIPIKVNLPENWKDLILERIKQDGDWQLVTRCKDCKHGQCHNPDGTRICEALDDLPMNEDDFCSKAEPWKGEADVGDK